MKRGETYVSSPELVFVEMAQELSFEKLVLLGLLLCGHEAGKDERVITTAQKIKRFTENIHGVKGKKSAILAAKYLVDGAASAHEAILYMLLCLPRYYGGYGLAAPLFNARIDVPKEYMRVAGRKSFYADILWRKERLVLEYDSKTFHDNEGSWVKDGNKSMTLKSMGYIVESINTAQLYNKSSFDVCATVIMKALGRRKIMRAADFGEKQRKIMSLLNHTAPLSGKT